MTWLDNRNVAKQILAAKAHRRYPKSTRTTSEDRRIVFLGIAVAAGVWEKEFSTALRKLAEANLGQEILLSQLQAARTYERHLSKAGAIWAEPAENYFEPRRYKREKWILIEKLPCKLPNGWNGGGYFLHGFINSQFRTYFSDRLPTELERSLISSQPTQVPIAIALPTAPNPKIVHCHCGAIIQAGSRKAALKELARHKSKEHRRKEHKRPSKN